MKLSLVALSLLSALVHAAPLNGTDVLVERSTIPGPHSGHLFTFVNKCKHTVTPAIGNTRCGYSARCDGSKAYSGPQPGQLKPNGAKSQYYIDNTWVGRIWNRENKCGKTGENCSMAEFNLDSGSFYTPQAYDISNIQGYTQSMGVKAAGCDEVRCTSPSCGCSQAYRVADLTGCGNDYPVRACGAGPIAFTVTFCP
ncbi:Osmotin, thaumatin-like protein [Exidia glandulosa HHB12029]|uniref:Osmotin, thaumatin-like protein n=1 Tax=Exidia glandulosa HHB12029 TaxID=1314781 RepID=A0A165NFE1_EXIGL|nr:Osmotin, thaumatin-like protein [Exidia glandulosa HHB12029]